MVLPDAASTPQLLLRFTYHASESLVRATKDRLEAHGFQVIHDAVDQGKVVFVLGVKQEQLEKQAERVGLDKWTRDRLVEPFTFSQRENFEEVGRYRDADSIFTASERTYLAVSLFDDVTVSNGPRPSPLSRVLQTEFDRIDDGGHSERSSDSILNSSDRSLKRFAKAMAKHGTHASNSLRHVLEAYDLVDVVMPVHCPAIRQEIFLRTLRPFTRLNPPVHAIQDYYGWKVAFYFAWMGHLTTWLLFPGFLGIVVFAWRLYRNETIDEDHFTPFYGVATFVWAIFFARFWDRQENRMAYEWGTFSFLPFEGRRFWGIRPQFTGYLRRSPITGEPETFYPAHRRRLKYIASGVVTTLMLGIAFMVMVASLNLQGYIRPHLNPGRWSHPSDHPFHIHRLAVLSAEGSLFDATSSWRCYLPVVLHVVCILGMNSVYRVIAISLTEWENHETDRDYQNSLVLKRFLFEAFDSYIALFYLAFYERDVERLRLELMAVFQVDTFRRVLLECLVPMAMQHFRPHHQSAASVLQDSCPIDSSREIPPPSLEQILEDIDKDPYDDFDDYMEICIQLGYTTLFASAYPLASILSVAANWVEIRSDCFKLTLLCHKPIPVRASGMGMWKQLFSSIVWISALTNCLVAGFTSDQLMTYLPNLYVRDSAGFTIFGHEKGWLHVFAVFALERLLLVIGLLIYAIVPAVPEDVTDRIARQQYLRRTDRESSHNKQD